MANPIDAGTKGEPSRAGIAKKQLAPLILSISLT